MTTAAMYYIRRMRNAALLILLTSTVFTAAALDELTLSDERGVAHRLFGETQSKAIVILVQGNGCPIVRSVLPRYREIRDAYRDRGVEFLLVNSNMHDSAAAVIDESNQFGFDVPVLLDRDQRLADALDIVRTAEVFVIDPTRREVVYRGPIDDRTTYGREKATTGAAYLRDALESLLAGGTIDVAERSAPGCLVRREHRS